MDITQESCRTFIEVLASNAPAPGGGGAAALMGAVGTALGNMVGSLTLGKKKYADVEAEILLLKERCDTIQRQLLDQVEADEIGFAPLARAYAIPKDDPRRPSALETASIEACDVPLRIMELCGEAIECIQVLSAKGSRLAVSDAACGAVCCKAALQAASLSVFINASGLTDRAAAEALNSRATALTEKYCALADDIFSAVKAGFGR